ncbi:tyrosine--tRNA ligase [bacterium]|nr:tyrosine--tRNA ligase [bacterium]
MISPEEQIKTLQVGTEQILPKEELRKKLKRGKPLIVKFGADPTAPDLHLGHAVVLSKLRQFQDLGHKIVFLIGDFTTKIGDPSGRSKTRPPLSDKEIKQNAETYFTQVAKILDPKKTEIVYNSTWLNKMMLSDILKLLGKVTVARIIEREDFKNRLDKNLPLGSHELLYPLLQGYDSVELKADLELGGSDQTFNLLMGRHLQEQYDQEPQVVMTFPLLEGTDGVEKMSKSYNNYIGLFETAENAFGKLMSISDDLMFRYSLLLLHTSNEEIEKQKKEIASGSLHPMDHKKKIAHTIVTKFWSKEEADKGLEHFKSIFQKKDYEQATEVKVSGLESPCWIVDLLKTTGAVTTSSQAKQLIEAGAVTIDDVKVADFKATVKWKAGSIIKAGKKKIIKIS